MNLRALLVIVILSCVSFRVALADPPADAAAVAQQAFDKKDWARAATLFDELTKKSPSSPRYWMHLGLALHFGGQLDKAVPAYERAIALKAPMASIAHYNLGCIFAQRGRVDDAFVALERAISTGTSREQLLGDADLSSLRKLPRWDALLAFEEKTNHPCRAGVSPEYRQFDFWLGNWDVYNGAQKVGTSHIDSAADGCLLVENWTSVHAHSGKSLNFYSAREQRWRQTWVGSGGDISEFYGVFADGEIRFASEEWDPKGKAYKRKLTFSRNADGSVRQFSERSDDGGKTYYSDYDFTYKKAAIAKP